MGNRKTDRAPYKGIAIPADRVTLDAITAQGSGLTDSSFSQRGPRPGSAVSADPLAKLDPQISGAQKIGVELDVRTAGLPGTDGVGVVWRESDVNDNYAWRDLVNPNFANHWVAAVWTDSATWDLFDLVAIPKTGGLVLLYADSSTDGSIFAKTFEFPEVSEDTNPQSAPTATGQWSSAVRVSRNINASSLFGDLFTWVWVTGVALPNGRILAFGLGVDPGVAEIRGYASDDGGTTWTLYSRFRGITALIENRARAAYHDGTILLLQSDPVTSDYTQFASSDLGATFDVVETDASSGLTEIHRSPSVTTIPGDGGIAIAYERLSSGEIGVRVISHAYQPISSATEVIVESGATVDNVEIIADGAGRLWVYGRTPATDEVRIWVSTDNGASFERCRVPFLAQQAALHLNHDANARLDNFAAAYCRGWAVLAHNWVAAVGNEDGSIGTLWSGGWSSVGHNAGFDITGVGALVIRPSWGQTARTVSPTQSGTGIPIELPADVGPWINGGATAPTLQPPGELEIALAASTGRFEMDPVGTAGFEHSVMFEMKITAGTASGASAQAGMPVLRIANGVYDFRVSIRFVTTGAGSIAVIDVNGASTVGTITPWDVTEWTQIIVGVNASGNLIMAYRRPWHTRWFQGPSLEGGSTLTDGGASALTNRIELGNNSAGTTVTMRFRQWHHFQQFFSPNGLSFGLIVNDASNKSHQVGGLISSRPMPLPEIGDQGVQEAFLAATRGPGRVLDTYTIEPVYDFGIDRLFPTISPSPGEPWRSDDLTEQRITFDLGADTRLGPIWHWLIGLLNTNVRSMTISGKTAAAGSFTVLATYNGAQGFEDLTFERNGDWIRPATGTDDADRFLERNSLAGGFAILDTAGTPAALRIDQNSAGGWTDPSLRNTLLPEIRLVGVTGGTPTGGLCDLVFPDGVLPRAFNVDNPPTQYIRYLRFTIPVQDVPDAYYQIGNLFAGTTAVFGKRWSRGWSQALIPNTARRVSRRGVVRKRRDGPPARRWSAGWTDGVIRRRLLGSGVDPDFIADGSPPVAIAAVDDVLGTLFAILEETAGTELPVLAINSIVSGATVNDRLRFLYGTIDANAQWNNVTGEERDGDFGRIDPITVNELVK